MTKVTMLDPVAYLSCCPESGRPEWSESCVWEDAVFTDEETGTISRAIVFLDDLESYTNDRVKQALYDASIVADNWVMRNCGETIVDEVWVGEAIRTLIQKDEA